MQIPIEKQTKSISEQSTISTDQQSWAGQWLWLVKQINQK